MSLLHVPNGGTTEQPTFGALLKKYRHAAGLTQEDLAERAHLSVRGISDLERGVSRAPRSYTLQLLAAALTLSARERALFMSVAARPSTPAPPVPRHLTTVQANHVQHQGESLAGSSAPPFVGRTRELSLIDAHLTGQGPPLLLLAGQPGIGKSRLLQLAIERAQMGGWHVLLGGCQRHGGQGPYAPLLEALELYIGAQSPLQLRALLDGCAWLVRLLPELAAGPIEPLPPWQVSAEHEHRLMVRAVNRFLANVAGPAGTLLVLDDLQWAGPDALELLTGLLRAGQGARLRVLGAYRDTEVSPEHPLTLMLADLAQVELVQQRSIGPLTLAEARSLLEALLAGYGTIAPDAAEQALQRMGGVPYFVVSWARGLEDSVAGEIPVPWTLSQSIRQRVAALPAVAQEVLAGAAVLGRVIARQALLGMCTLPRAEVLAGIDAACRARLLEEEGEMAYRFAHDIVREVVEGDLGSARRAALHQRAGDVLEALPGPAAVERLAYHFARGETPARAVPYLEQAGDQARVQYAHEAAAGYYRELIALLDGMDAPAALASACERLGAVLTITAQYDEALVMLERAAAYRTATRELEDLGRVTAQIAHVLGQKGMPAEGLARIQMLLSGLEERGPSPSLVELYAVQVVLYDWLYLPVERLAAAARALELAHALRDDDLLATALGRYGYGLIQVGRVEEGLQALEEARRLAHARGDLSSLYHILLWASMGHYALGQLAASGRYAELGLEVAQRLGDPLAITSNLAHHGRNAFLTGDWRRARTDLEQAVALARPTGSAPWFVQAATFLGEFYLATGEWDEAMRHLEEAKSSAEGTSAGRLRHVQGLLAEHDLYVGRPEAARDRLLPLAAAENTFAPWLRTQLAWAYLELDEVHLAAATVSRAIQQSRAEKHRIRLVDGLHVQAMVLVRLGQADQAAGALDEGLSLTPTIPYPYGEARLLRVYGSLHAKMCEPEAARMRLEAALTIFRRLGAAKDVEWTTLDLANLPL